MLRLLPEILKPKPVVYPDSIERWVAIKKQFGEVYCSNLAEDKQELYSFVKRGYELLQVTIPVSRKEPNLGH